MQYRPFGKIGFEISALGFGAMRLPKNPDDTYDVDESVRMIHRSFELGVNYIDTAPYYCEKQSEVIVGKALKGWRDRVMLSTKYPTDDASPSDIREKLESSLRNLDVECIDFYHLWGIGWERFTAIEKSGALREAMKLKDEGLIKHLSFSFHDAADNMRKIIDAADFASVLCQYNLLDRANEDAIHYAHEKGLGVVIMGPVGGGRLGMPSEAIQALLPGKSFSTPQLAMRFVLSHPGVSCALSGMSTMEQVEQNIVTCSDAAPLSDAEQQQVVQAMEEHKKRAELYCTGCNYCMPCPQDVGIPQIFEMMNYHRVYGLTEHAQKQYSQIGSEHKKFANASACIECGLCENKCPQHIEIRKQLAETAAVLG